MADPTDTAADPAPVQVPSSQRLADGWEQVAVDRLHRTHDPGSETGKKVTSDVPSMFRFFEGLGIEEWGEVDVDAAEAWYWAAVERDDEFDKPADSTARGHQWIARLVFTVVAELGAHIDPASVVGAKVQQGPPASTARPLRGDELARVHAFADAGLLPTMKTMSVAVSLASASAPEAAATRIEHIDLNAGTITFTGPAARTVPLEGWPAKVIDRYLAAHPELGPEDLLCVRSTTAPARRARSVLNQLCKVLRNAGFADNPDISGRSLRLTAARAVFDRTNSIEATAQLLGSPSLDNTAAAIGWDWREHDDNEPLGTDRDAVVGPAPFVRNDRDAAGFTPFARNGRDAAGSAVFRSGDGGGDA